MARETASERQAREAKEKQDRQDAEAAAFSQVETLVGAIQIQLTSHDVPTDVRSTSYELLAVIDRIRPKWMAVHMKSECAGDEVVLSFVPRSAKAIMNTYGMHRLADVIKILDGFNPTMFLAEVKGALTSAHEIIELKKQIKDLKDDFRRQDGFYPSPWAHVMRMRGCPPRLPHWGKHEAERG